MSIVPHDTGFRTGIYTVLKLHRNYYFFLGARKKFHKRGVKKTIILKPVKMVRRTLSRTIAKEYYNSGERLYSTPNTRTSGDL